MVLVLIGYMASGKSTIGRILAKKLQYNFIDLDEFIEVKENTTIKKLFLDKGEIYFRRVETKYLSELINTKGNLILSLGGGTPCYGSNMQMIMQAKKAISFYLKASIKTIINRVKDETNKRPLIAHLSSEEDIEEFIGKHLFERAQFYNQSKHIIATDNLSVDEIVEQIVLKLY